MFAKSKMVNLLRVGFLGVVNIIGWQFSAIHGRKKKVCTAHSHYKTHLIQNHSHSWTLLLPFVSYWNLPKKSNSFVHPLPSRLYAILIKISNIFRMMAQCSACQSWLKMRSFPKRWIYRLLLWPWSLFMLQNQTQLIKGCLHFHHTFGQPQHTCGFVQVTAAQNVPMLFQHHLLLLLKCILHWCCCCCNTARCKDSGSVSNLMLNGSTHYFFTLYY